MIIKEDKERMLTEETGNANLKTTKRQISISARAIDNKGKIVKGKSIEDKEKPANSSSLNWNVCNLILNYTIFSENNDRST